VHNDGTMMVALLAAAMLIPYAGRPAEAGRYVVNVTNDAANDPIPVASGFRRTAFQQPHSAALYDQGISYERFLAGASARAEEWRRNSREAVVAEVASGKIRVLESPRRVLVVTEASCSDSVATIPYLAKLVEQAPDRLEMRLVNSKAGRAVMEAHRTPDGRAATPTVIVLDGEGRFVAAWIERPAALQQWHAEHHVTNTTRALLPAKMQWYADDAGRSTVTELVTALTAR
jgi:hypothetical protein